jgi:ABC-type transporter Mla subunit MlaD
MNTTIPQRAPTILRSIAVAGVLVAIIGTVVIWTFLGDLEDTTDRSLLIGEQATVTLNETLDVAEQVLDAVDDGLSTVQATLGTLDDVLQSTAGLADATGSLSAALPSTFENIDAALATVEQLAETVDSTLAALSSLPFGPDYNPDVPFPAAIGNLRTALDPISEQLATISAELQNFAAGSGDLNAEIDSLTADVERTREALSGTDALLTQYRQTTTEAGALAAETRDNLSASVTRMRIALIGLALLLALSQFVPWTMAALIDERHAPRERDVVVVAPSAVDLGASDGHADAVRGSATP